MYVKSALAVNIERRIGVKGVEILYMALLSMGMIGFGIFAFQVVALFVE